MVSDGKVPVDIKLCQLVRLFKNGEPFKMSKRAGSFVTLRDVVDEVGADADEDGVEEGGETAGECEDGC